MINIKIINKYNKYYIINKDICIYMIKLINYIKVYTNINKLIIIIIIVKIIIVIINIMININNIKII